MLRILMIIVSCLFIITPTISEAGHDEDINNKNSFFGYEAGISNGSTGYYGFEHTFVGHNAGKDHTGHCPNRGANETCGGSTFIGFEAGYKSHNNTSTFVGTKAGRNAERQSAGNTFIGASSGAGGNPGPYNTALGLSSGVLLNYPDNPVQVEFPYAWFNVLLGAEAGKKVTEGARNILIGVNAGAGHYTDGIDRSISSGHNNIHIGFQTEAIDGGLSDTIAIGHKAKVTKNNQMVLGSRVFKMDFDTYVDSDCDGTAERPYDGIVDGPASDLRCLPSGTIIRNDMCPDEQTIKTQWKVIGNCDYFNTHISESYWGSGVTSFDPQDFTINASGGERERVFSDGQYEDYTGPDIAGANLILAGGRGTGSEEGGKIIFQTAPASTAPCPGETTVPGELLLNEERNCPVDRMIIDSNGKVEIKGTDTSKVLHVESNLDSAPLPAGNNYAAYYKVNMNATGLNSRQVKAFSASIVYGGQGNPFSGMMGADYNLSLGTSAPGTHVINNISGDNIQFTRTTLNSKDITVTNYSAFNSSFNASTGYASGEISGTDWQHIYLEAIDDTAVFKPENMMGIWIDKQVGGTINNSGIVLDGDGAGADIVLGLGQQNSIYSSAGDVYIDGGDLYVSGSYYPSDENLKERITPIKSPVATVMNLNGISFKWKTKDTRKNQGDEGSHFGVIAQEIEKVLPNLVKENAKGEKSVAYTELIPVLIEAVKEQQKTIERMSKELSEIKSEVKLKGSLAMIELDK